MQTNVRNVVIASLLLLLAGTTAISAASKDADTMAAVSKVKAAVQSSDKLSAATKAYAIDKLLPITASDALVAAVKAQNAKGVSLAEIQEIDKKWIAAEEELPIQMETRTNACAQELVKLLKGATNVVEAFVMDNQGAVVCENSLTSDYWQGDEAKWKNSFNGGAGGLDAGKVKFDKSANAKLQQVSLPILAEGGKAIGAITFGVDVTAL